MYFLGWMYYKGRGLPRDPQKAVTWFRAAADAGDRDGMYWLGEANEEGCGLPKDRSHALFWYENVLLKTLSTLMSSPMLEPARILS